MEEKKEGYISVLEQRLNRFYISIRDYGKTDAEVSSGIEAFMEAGLLLGAVTRAELDSLIELQHKTVFGMSLGERQQSEKLEAHAQGNYVSFDTPAWQRQKVKIPSLS